MEGAWVLALWNPRQSDTGAPDSLGGTSLHEGEKNTPHLQKNQIQISDKQNNGPPKDVPVLIPSYDKGEIRWQME